METMADLWEGLVDKVEALLPPEIADYETEVLVVAIITTSLAFLGEGCAHASVDY